MKHGMVTENRSMGSVWLEAGAAEFERNVGSYSGFEMERVSLFQENKFMKLVHTYYIHRYIYFGH